MIFSKVRGFLRGLNPDLKKEVESKAPKMLDEAIQQAHIYDDETGQFEDHKSSNFQSHKFKSSTTTRSGNNKRKNVHDTLGTTKKPKGSGESLTPEEFARAKKESLCFKCLGNHSKKDCCQLKTVAREKTKWCTRCNYYLLTPHQSILVCKLHTLVRSMSVVLPHPCGSLFLGHMSFYVCTESSMDTRFVF